MEGETHSAKTKRKIRGIEKKKKNSEVEKKRPKIENTSEKKKQRVNRDGNKGKERKWKGGNDGKKRRGRDKRKKDGKWRESHFEQSTETGGEKRMNAGS